MTLLPLEPVRYSPVIIRTPTQSLKLRSRRACVALSGVNCPSPIVFDNDGQILDSPFGRDAAVLGVSGPDLFIPSRNLIIAGSSVINGTFFTAEAERQRRTIDPNDTNPLFLEGILVHEIGHFSGSVIESLNGDIALLNPAIRGLGGSGSPPPPRTQPADVRPIGRTGDGSLEDVETMYPTSLIGTTGKQNIPEPDDESALATLYPCTDAITTNSGCSRSVSTTGAITGRVFIPDPVNPGQFKSPKELWLLLDGLTLMILREPEGIRIAAYR